MIYNVLRKLLGIVTTRLLFLLYFLNITFLVYWQGKVGTINKITNEYIGPSLITFGEEYYEYLGNLVSFTLQIDFSLSEIASNDIEQLIKYYYKENKPKYFFKSKICYNIC